MKIITDINKMRLWSKGTGQQNKTIAFVPTMGYLHEGHLSLMRKARSENDYLVVSIFVNPAQFGPKEDLKRYPRNFTRDKRLARLCGTDIIFYPRACDMYPDGYKTYVNVEGLSNVLCGVSRPGHFRGVATVVLKLFNVVGPDIAYFGRKDAQQAIIIKKMVSDLNLSVKIKVLPIVREKDGLAMSSRNRYLGRGQRENAIILYKSLQTAVGMVKSKNKSPREITALVRRMIKSKGATRIDYVKIVDINSLEEVKKIKGRLLIAVAVFFGKTRLIDNVIVAG